MDKVKEKVGFFFAAMAIFTLLCAAYQAMNGKLGSAGVLAGLFVTSALLVYLPQLQVFKAFGVEARLNQSLDRAEDIIKDLQKTSAANARIAYFTATWANRWGGPTVAEKQRILDQLNTELRAIGVSDNELYDVVKPYLQSIAFDFANLYKQVIYGQLFRLAAQRPEDQAYKKAIENWLASRQFRINDDVLRIDEVLSSLTPTDLLSKQDVERANGLKSKFAAMVKESIERRGLTPEAASFLAQHTESKVQLDLSVNLFRDEASP